MKIAVYSLTWDRLEYTKHCFQSLWDNAGCDFDHWVVDNGSDDGTVAWLEQQTRVRSVLLPKNMGNAVGNNIAQDALRGHGYDYIVRMDNDCEVKTYNILGQFVQIFQAVGQYTGKYILSPKVEGIVHQPKRARFIEIDHHTIGVVGILGGLFRISPAEVFFNYRWPEGQNKIFGEESFAESFHRKGGTLGYVEDLVVNHYEGTDAQALRFPGYHKRKMALAHPNSPDEVG